MQTLIERGCGLPMRPEYRLATASLMLTDERRGLALQFQQLLVTESSGRPPCPCTTTFATIVIRPSN